MLKSSVWILHTEVGVSSESSNPSSSEIIKHHCSEEPVGFFKTSSRLLPLQPTFFFLYPLLLLFFQLTSWYFLLPLHSAFFFSLSSNLALKCTLGLKKASKRWKKQVHNQTSYSAGGLFLCHSILQQNFIFRFCYVTFLKLKLMKSVPDLRAHTSLCTSRCIKHGV